MSVLNQGGGEIRGIDNNDEDKEYPGQYTHQECRPLRRNKQNLILSHRRKEGNKPSSKKNYSKISALEKLVEVQNKKYLRYNQLERNRILAEHP